MCKKSLLIFFSCLCLLGASLFTKAAWAVFEMTVTPNEGSYDLRFERVSPDDFKMVKELTIRVNTDIGKAYRVFHRLNQPLTASDGIVLSDEQFRMYPVVNSSSTGQLIYREETPVSQFENQMIYTSDSSGTSDTFKVIYTVTPKQAQIAGSYYGRLCYVLIPVDNSTLSQVVVNVNVYVELSQGATPLVEVTTEKGTKRLTFSSKKSGFKQEDTGIQQQVSVKIHGSIGVPYKIYQTLSEGRILSSAGLEFDLSHLLATVTGNEKGVTMSASTLVAASTKQLLYTSDRSGSGDAFVITYKGDDDFRMQPADFYRSRLNYILETEGAQGAIKKDSVAVLDLELDITPIFDIRVFTDGKEGVNLVFGDISYKSGPKTSTAEVFIDTNMGKPYQVVQKSTGPMVTQDATKVPPEDFTLSVKDIITDEEPRFVLKESKPVQEGDMVIFSSGPLGKEAHFRVEYRLNMRPDTRTGSYATQIGYALVLD
jgi:hypothetical protein